MSARWRGLGLLLAGGGALFLLMAQEGHVPFATIWGALCLLTTVVGLFVTLGLLERAGPDATPIQDTWLGRMPGERAWMAPLWAIPVAGLSVLLCAAAIPAQLPWAIGVALLWLVPAALRRPGLFVFVVCSGLLLPILGAFGLWDPWETHYGEVAREILARDDWISLWWAQDRWFWSKPILIFWAEALTWNATSVGFWPDSQFQQSEWILRLPVYVLAMLALLAVQQVVARRVSVRAGVLSALVLASTPYFGFLTHQAITDMYFVACMTVALMLLLLSVAEDPDPDREVRRYRLWGYAVDGQHLVLGLIVFVALPQVLYLASRNVALIDGFLFAWHLDDFPFGSAGNADVPGNFGYRLQRPFYQALWVQPMAQAVLWAAGLGLIVNGLRRERRVQPLLMAGFYLFCALSFMGKGIPGFALPGLVALLFLVVTERWSLLLKGRLRVGQGILIISVLALPWFVAMFVRHGPAFTDRLLVHDHINRLTTGVHGDKGTIQYFINQLGYGLFPWIALAPAALGAWLGAAGTTPEQRARREALTVAGLWFAAAFTLFSAMTTKFHHYIFPAVPPAAILTGVTLDRMLGARAFSGARARIGALLAVLAPVPWLLAVAGYFGDVRGVLPPGLGESDAAVWVFQHPWPLPVTLALAALGLAMLLGAERLQAVPAAGRHAAGLDWGLSGALIAGAVVAAFAGRDLAWTTSVRPVGNELLAHLFIYNYDRPWPLELDYRPLLSGFAAVTVAATLMSAFSRFRPLMAQALVGLGLAFSVFCLDVYMVDATPHWTQAHLVQRYYDLRDSPDQELVAWQMNWKGENFYTGNRVSVFQALDNKEITKWLDSHAGKRAFFLLEHKRLTRFKRLLGKRPVKELSTERDCNKFILVEAQL